MTDTVKIPVCEGCIEVRFDASLMQVVMFDDVPRLCAICAELRRPLYVLWVEVTCGGCGHALVDHYPSEVAGMDACLPCMDESSVCLIPRAVSPAPDPAETASLWPDSRGVQ